MRYPTLILQTVLFSLLFCAAAYLLRGLSPDYQSTRLEVEGRTYREFLLPIRFTAQNSAATALLRFRLKRVFARKFLFQADDCIDELWINSRRYEEAVFPLCNYPFGRVLDLGQYLQPGANAIRLVIANHGGPGRLDFRPAAVDPAVLLLRLCLVLTIGWYGAVLGSRGGSGRLHPLYLIFLAGALIRVFYFLSTPYWIRAYDWPAHLEYITYLAEHYRIPPYNHGWQTHHPPLYHIFGAIWLKAARFCRAEMDVVCEGLQLGALFASLAVLAAAVRMSRDLFGEQRGSIETCLYSSLLAVHPGLIYFSARLNNDPLVLLFSILAFWGLTRWWTTGSTRAWTAASVFGALGLLTKANAGVILAAAVFLVLVRKNDRHRRARELLIIGAAAGIICGGIVFVRAAAQGQRSLVADMAGSLDLRVSNEVSNYLVFNPAAVLRTPFVLPRDDAARRSNLWEYLFRSAYFGEFEMPKALRAPAQSALLAGMLCLPVIIAGVILDYRGRNLRAVPQAAALVFSLGAISVLRMAVPYAPAQDFRYIAAAAVPSAYFAARGSACAHGTGVALIIWHVVSCLAAIIAVLLLPPAFTF